jgi:hypothetical protein
MNSEAVLKKLGVAPNPARKQGVQSASDAKAQADKATTIKAAMRAKGGIAA